MQKVIICAGVAAYHHKAVHMEISGCKKADIQSLVLPNQLDLDQIIGPLPFSFLGIQEELCKLQEDILLIKERAFDMTSQIDIEAEL